MMTCLIHLGIAKVGSMKLNQLHLCQNSCCSRIALLQHLFVSHLVRSPEVQALGVSLPVMLDKVSSFL